MGSLGRIERPCARVLLAVVVLVLGLSACTPVYRDSGYIPSEDDLKQVVVGTTTRGEVADVVGRPSSSGVLSGSAWYYVGSRFKYFGARAPQEIDRQVIAISFDDKDVVSNIERFGLADGKVVTISRRVTESGIQSSGLLRQLLGNLGNFNPSTVLGAPEN